MLSVLLGLTGAVVYGAADFLGGLAARRIRAVTVAAVAAAVGLLPLVLGVPVVGAALSGAAVAAGVAAGVSGSVAVLLLYRALAVGPMSVLSPLTAVFAAVTPVAVALLGGTVLSLAASVALVVAVVAVVLVAAVRDTSGARVTAVGVVTAAVAGCGFGGIVLAYDAAPADAGVATLLVGRVVQTVLLGAVAVVVAVRSGTVRTGGADHVAPSASAGRPAAGGPRGQRRQGTSRWSGRSRWSRWSGRSRWSRWSGRSRWSRRTVVAVVACGALDALANACIQAALHVGSGDAALPVVSVLNALYPIGTVALAGVVLRERLTAVQWTGIVLAFVASIGLALA
ncbi:EamA family transporter [Curtobacterium sp. RHCJP20]|uniref:EamA family transporter n=1 Tax=Curtobacterium subtropicum TaxID=3055138 RepID=A0ABT7TDA0_9MICO|nr:EamA family transporter [Curtobacterium subtropicum]MDM7887359.1 EamA family transporter [Curtobacterium subtropicum]